MDIRPIHDVPHQSYSAVVRTDVRRCSSNLVVSPATLLKRDSSIGEYCEIFITVFLYRIILMAASEFCIEITS